MSVCHHLPLREPPPRHVDVRYTLPATLYCGARTAKQPMLILPVQRSGEESGPVRVLRRAGKPAWENQCAND